jgi:[acyl-carrier-protein] S-malonyltransferase
VTFPGQGSQQPGAGAPWRASPQWRLVEQGSAVLDRDLVALLLDTPAEQLRQPWEAQVSTYLVSMLCWDAYAGPEPAALAGHSLGEWTALAASGAVSFAGGLRLVGARGAAMADAAAARPGGMAALVGASDEAVARACAAAEQVWPANFNADGQVVVSGEPSHFAEVGEACGARRVLPLPVGGAYHTPWMEPARAALAAALDADPPGRANIPIWSNVDAAAHADGFAERLLTQLTAPVRWRQTVEGLLAAGVDDFVELGPGAVLTNLAKRNAPTAARRSAASPEDLREIA